VIVVAVSGIFDLELAVPHLSRHNIFRIGLSLCLVCLGTAASFGRESRAAGENPSALSALQQVAYIHGQQGPYAVAGYRIGERALALLSLPRESFDLEVIHITPFQVQWSCIADGVQAATGASIGKLNLRLQEAPLAQMRTLIRNRKTGQELSFRLTPEFNKRFLDLPEDKLAAAGESVMSLSDQQIFTVESAK
jgi:formylmethanofuran dehydrogenase subunit E